jgi:4-hydroxy-3-methylbut-2-enyl diphosphate reductase IspH
MNPAAVELRLVVALTNSRNSHRLERIQRRLPERLLTITNSHMSPLLEKQRSAGY